MNCIIVISGIAKSFRRIGLEVWVVHVLQDYQQVKKMDPEYDVYE